MFASILDSGLQQNINRRNGKQAMRRGKYLDYRACGFRISEPSIPGAFKCGRVFLNFLVWVVAWFPVSIEGLRQRTGVV